MKELLDQTHDKFGNARGFGFNLFSVYKKHHQRMPLPGVMNYK